MQDVVIAVVAAIIYSLSMYVKKALSDNPESFDWTKFLATAIWGAIVGLVMQSSGLPITEQSVEEKIAAYAGLIAITENILKIVWRAISRR